MSPAGAPMSGAEVKVFVFQSFRILENAVPSARQSNGSYVKNPFRHSYKSKKENIFWPRSSQIKILKNSGGWGEGIASPAFPVALPLNLELPN